MEIQINLPLQTMVEQVEMKLNHNQDKLELFKKYLKVSGLTRTSVLRKEAIERDSQIGPDI